MPLEIHPKWLQRLYHAVAPWHLLIFLVTEIAAVFLGKHYGEIIGYAFGFGFLLAWLMIQAAVYSLAPMDEAIKTLQRISEVTLAENLAKVRRGGVIISIVALIGFIVLITPFLINYWSTWTSHKPESISFEKLTYYQPKEEEEEDLEMPSFLQGLVTLLRKEGESTKKPYRVAVGFTKTIKHYSPKFACYLEVGQKDYETTGYAFRIHGEKERREYEPMSGDYSEPTKVVFDIPSCKTGDRFLFLVRLTSPNEAVFPEDLIRFSALKVVK